MPKHSTKSGSLMSAKSRVLAFIVMCTMIPLLCGPVRAAPPTNEFECMVTAIYFEARGEPPLGQRWVFDVIRNRAALNYRGQSTWCDVVYDRWQFSFANADNSIRPREGRTLERIRARVHDWMYDPTDVTCGATHYLRYDIAWKIRWSIQALQGRSDENLVPLAIIGDHWFFGPKQECSWR